MSDAQAYATLQVRPGMAWGQVAQAYRSAARATHPDMGGTAEAFRAVADAYAILETLRLVDTDTLGSPDDFLPWPDTDDTAPADTWGTPAPTPQTAPPSPEPGAPSSGGRRRWWQRRPPEVYEGPALRRGEPEVRPRRVA